MRSTLLQGLSLSIGASVTLVATPASADVEIAPLVMIDLSAFEGNGFAPEPAAGQLDSDDWSVTLGAEFLVDFGGTADAGSAFGYGTSPGGTDVPGIHAFDVDGAGLIGLGVQPADQTFTPGQIALRLVNNTGAEITALQVEYTVWANNDVDRANSLNLMQSTDNVDYTQVGGDFVSPAAADQNGFTPTEIVHVVTPQDPIADGAQFYLAWAGDDVSGDGSRDEFAIEAIAIRLPDACGNGILENKEACDDGNTDDGDGCAADCTLDDAGTTGADSTGADSTGADVTGADATGAEVTGNTSDSDVTTDVTGASMTDATATSPTTTSPTGGIDTDDGEDTGSGGEDEQATGCSCNSSGSAAPIMGMLGLLALVRRRRA